uniref:Putative secreted protein n=1 Tax=Psorophora albipes TaxID=869069 RepID=T1E2T5_9DIPT
MIIIVEFLCDLKYVACDGFGIFNMVFRLDIVLYLITHYFLYSFVTAWPITKKIIPLNCSLKSFISKLLSSVLLCGCYETMYNFDS